MMALDQGCVNRNDDLISGVGKLKQSMDWSKSGDLFDRANRVPLNSRSCSTDIKIINDVLKAAMPIATIRHGFDS
jgi:hypothetical protein